MELISRLVTPRLTELVSAFRVVIVNGARQSGKTTLLESFLTDHGGELRSLDIKSLRNAANSDPATFTQTTSRPLIIDEVQRGGDSLVLAIKYEVDRNRQPGQFILSGSTRFLTVPTLSESLAGRAAFVEVWPLSMVERTGANRTLRALFTEPKSFLEASTSQWTRDDYLELCCVGGFPEAIFSPSSELRREWFKGYVHTVATRDIQEFAHIHQATLLPKLATLIAARTGSTLVHADLANSLQISVPTLRTYLSYLETVFFYTDVAPWSSNLTSKVVKTPKAFPVDSGLTAGLLKANPTTLRAPADARLGPIVETFVYNELLRLSAVDKFDIYFYRDRNGREIDFLLEDSNGQLVAIEVKASASPSASDAKNLYWLREKLGDKLRAGIILHLGPHSLSFGNGVLSLPISVLWEHRK